MMKAGAFLVCALFATACGVGDETEQIDPNPLKAVCSSGFKTTGTFQQTEAKVGPTTPDNPTGEISGCFPIGVWTFTAAVDPEVEAIDVDGDGVGDRCGEDGTAAPELMAEYSFRVDRIQATDGSGAIDKYFAKCGGNFVSLDDQAGRDACASALGGYQVARLKVTEGGSGECTGNLEIFDAEYKKHWNFHPAQTSLPPGMEPGQTTIAGFGEYTEFKEPQVIGSDE